MCFDINKHNTEVYNNMFEEILKVDELHEPNEYYCPDRTDALYWTIRKLSRDKMSVHMI